MVRALAIETSGRTGSVALVEGGAVVAQDQFPHGLRHAAEIVNRIDALCRAVHWKPGDLAHLYVSIGPGSFTGLRIGVTLAKTLAFATGALVVAVPSVEVLVRNAPPGWQHAVIVLDAKRDQVFTARFANQDGEPVEAEPAHLDSLAAMLERSPRPVHLIGEGVPFHERFIAQAGAGIVLTPPELWQARASAVARIGTRLADQGKFVAADRLTPLYVRKPEAEEKFAERMRLGAAVE
jgi:tRNA threonylcarbamoyladenosine biosynthesis protein TsaB